ncbi:MAG TPA: PfkB family carbohydrate kinase [Balneolaceae bacterium]|nr:PfkB family carbohydrate kinase [Balneolaceae bacterium]
MKKVLSIGEVLWDVFPTYKKPGGSPANLAYHLHCLGNRTLFASRVGNDENGKELIRFLSKKGISTDHIQTDNAQPTGKVTVTFTDDEPSYVIHEPAAWDFIEYTEDLKAAAAELDAICFASLSQRHHVTAGTLQHLLNDVPDSCLKVFDLNLRPPFTNPELITRQILIADVVKFNEDEFEEAKKWFDTDEPAAFLLAKDPEKTILRTLGADGSEMFTTSGIVREDAYPISGEGDFVGVGDAFLACFTHLKLQDTPSNDILAKANRYAAVVASQQGGMPEIHKSILASL